MVGFVPYCGSPPSPFTLHWNDAPILTAILAVAPVAYLSLVRPFARSRALLLVSGWGIMALCFLSPLCNLGVALFSARATQHVILVLVAAPLMAGGCLGFRARSVSLLTVSAATFAVTVWVWHSPRLYDATLQNNWDYWAMNVTMIGSAVWFWRNVFTAQGLPSVAAVSFVGLEMCLLGALIAFAKSPFYTVHADTTWVWGLSQLDDQRLGGLIMWVPAGLLGVGYSAAAFWFWLARMDRRVLSNVTPGLSSPSASSRT